MDHPFSGTFQTLIKAEGKNALKGLSQVQVSTFARECHVWLLRIHRLKAVSRPHPAARRPGSGILFAPKAESWKNLVTSPKGSRIGLLQFLKQDKLFLA